MPNDYHATDPLKSLVVSMIIIGMLATSGNAAAQSAHIDKSVLLPDTQQSVAHSTDHRSDQPESLRKSRRVGTAIKAPPNSISVKSTDAGAIPPRTLPATGCINCGTIDFINRLNLNTLTSGIIAGTIAREAIQHVPHPHDNNQYQVGITMHNGNQTTLTLPDAANFHPGDRVRLIDGTVVLDR